MEGHDGSQAKSGSRPLAWLRDLCLPTLRVEGHGGSQATLDFLPLAWLPFYLCLPTPRVEGHDGSQAKSGSCPLDWLRDLRSPSLRLVDQDRCQARSVPCPLIWLGVRPSRLPTLRVDGFGGRQVNPRFHPQSWFWALTPHPSSPWVEDQRGCPTFPSFLPLILRYCNFLPALGLREGGFTFQSVVSGLRTGRATNPFIGIRERVFYSSRTSSVAVGRRSGLFTFPSGLASERGPSPRNAASV